MSLEQALNECTTVMKQLITVLSSGAGLPAAPGGDETESTETKRKRRTKAEIEADNAAAAAAQQTRYWHIASHATVYEQKPGDPDCTLAGAVQVNQAE